MWTRVVFIFIFWFGLAWAAPETRIINGTETDIHKFPFMVSLRYDGGYFQCGGSIIAPKWILTASHCVQNTIAEKITIQYGVSVIDRSGPNVANIKRYIMHENYDSIDLWNDVALIELYGSLIYNYKTIAPVNLPEQNFEIQQLTAGEPGILIGWGTNVTGGYAMDTLQAVDLKIYSDAECAERHGDAVTNNNICAGVDEGWKGQCNGDSGGPLLYNNNIQVGIVSWSIKPCTVPPYPGVYTKVSHYVDWINRQINA